MRADCSLNDKCHEKRTKTKVNRITTVRKKRASFSDGNVLGVAKLGTTFVIVKNKYAFIKLIKFKNTKKMFHFIILVITTV